MNSEEDTNVQIRAHIRPALDYKGYKDNEQGPVFSKSLPSR